MRIVALSLVLGACAAPPPGRDTPVHGDPESIEFFGDSDATDDDVEEDDDTTSSDQDAPDGDPTPTDGDSDTPRPRFLDVLRSEPYSRLVLEIDSVPGYEPRPSVTSSIVSGFTELVDKPGGVSAVNDQPLVSPGPGYVWSFAELADLAAESFDLAVDADTIKLHVLFVDGEYDNGGNPGRVLGIAWSFTHLVMFKEAIEDGCSGLLFQEQVCTAAERSIWTHEIGHLLGLVDNGLPMVEPHADAEHPAHDESDACVMYWAYDGEAALDVALERLLNGDPELGFDDACLADLAAVRQTP